MTFGHGSFDRLGYAAETLVFNATGTNYVNNSGTWVKSQFTSFYDNCYWSGTPYEMDEVLKIVQIASPDTTSDSDTHAGQTLGKTYRWAVRYRYRNKNDNTTGYDNITFVLKQSGEFTNYSKAACATYKKFMFLVEGKASAGSAETKQSPFFVSLADQGGSSQVVYSWESHGTGGCIGAPAIGTTSQGSGAWEIHNKPDYTVGGVSKPWRLTTYNCQTGAVVATTYHATKSAAQSEASNHVGDEYDTYKPVDCEISSWSSWGDYTTCVDNKQTRTRTRTVTTPARNGGRCNWDLSETQERSCTVTDAVACTVSEWSDWSEWAACVDGKETRTRTREITRQPAGGGQECPALTETEERDCTGDPTIITTDPLAGGTTPTTPALPTWAVPAGIGAIVLVALVSMS